MQHPPLETIAERLAEQLQCEQEDLCIQIIQQVTRGKPVVPAALQTALQVSRDELKHRLTKLPDTEFDPQGNVVGWGVTLVPTHHRFQIDGKSLFQTNCAQCHNPVSVVVGPALKGVTQRVTDTNLPAKALYVATGFEPTDLLQPVPSNPSLQERMFVRAL